MTKSDLEKKIKELESVNTELRQSIKSTSKFHMQEVEKNNRLDGINRVLLRQNVELSQILASYMGSENDS